MGHGTMQLLRWIDHKGGRGLLPLRRIDSGASQVLAVSILQEARSGKSTGSHPARDDERRSPGSKHGRLANGLAQATGV